MSDPQIVRLKKEIELLREHNAQLKQQIEEQALQLGQMETQHLNIMNKNLMLEEEQKLIKDSSKLQRIIESALSEEKANTEAFKMKNEKLQNQLQMYIQRIKDSEVFIQKLQQDNSRLKKELIDFSEKHEAKDFIDKIKTKDLEIQKVGEEKANTVRDWNELCDKMEEVLQENRVLRQIADVPENFGIDISKINMGDRIKIEDYKAKIRILQHEVDELEEERAKLKYRIEFLANSFQSTGEPFSLLNGEQKVELAKFAQMLYEGKEKVKPEKYDYNRQLRQKDEIIKNLENDIAIYKAQLRNKGIPSGIGKLSNNQMDEVMQMIKDNQKTMINLINSKDFSSSNTNMIINGTNTNYNQNRININDNTNNNNINLKNNNLKTTGNIRFNINNNLNGMPNNEIDYPENFQMSNDNSGIILNLDQLPPVPIYNENDPNNTNLSKSFRFNTQFKIDLKILKELFGLPSDINNSDELKKQAAALQSQIIELLEIETRRNNNDTTLNNNLNVLFNKYERIALILKNIFQRYMISKTSYEEKEEKFNNTINDLSTELATLRIINNNYEETIKLIEKKDNNETEKAILEKMRQNAVLESDLAKLKRKYFCLVDEEKKLREYVEMNDIYNLEKEKNMKETITRLKEWKSLLTYYLRFLNEKLKKSVDKERFDLLIEENKYLREKNNELTLRDISVTKEMVQTQTLMLKYKDLEDSYYQMQEAKYDSDIELNYLQKRLQDLDPNYYNEQKAFRKLVNKLSLLNMSFEQIRNAFIDIPNPNNKNNDNRRINGNIYDDLYFLKGLTANNSYITKRHFEECLRLNLGINENDLNKTDLILIYRVLNCDDEDMIDIRKLMKKIEQCIISEHRRENNELEILEKLIKCVQEKNKSLLEAFSIFDTNNNGCITKDEFIYALSQLGFDISEENINRLIFLVSGENPVDTEINIHKLDDRDNFNYVEFCELFESKSKNLLLKNRRTTINKNKEKIDWKVNLLTKIYFAMKNNHMDIDNSFDSFDKTEKGFLSLAEFATFIDYINIKINADNIKKLFFSFNYDYNYKREVDPKNYFVPIEKIKEDLHKVVLQSLEYKRLSEMLFMDNTKKIDINQKYNILLEEQKYYNIKYKDLEKKYNDLLNNNQLLTIQLQDYVKQNNTNIDKYFNTIEELQQLKLEYISTGVKRADYMRLITENDSLHREVNILRIGMNTFKELYNTSNFQVKQLHFNEMRNLDELDTYKKAIRELQGESNQNSLIGRLYYTILICRWREASTLRKYDDSLTTISQLKSDNFSLETVNKNLTKDINDIQNNLHEKIIENIRINDALENYENGIVGFTPNNEKVYPIDEMKKLVNMLKEDKRNNTEQLLKLKKKVLTLENEKNYLENEIDFCESLANNIRFNNRDEYSQKLIGMSEDIAKLKLHNNQLKREYNFIKENMEHIERVNQQLNQTITEYEKKNAEWETKYRKMEEIFHKRDEQRQKKLIEGLENLKIYKPDKLKNLLKNNNNKNQINNNINNKDNNKNSKNNNDDDNDDNNDNNDDNDNNDNNDESSDYNNISITKDQLQKMALNEEKIKQLNEVIIKKDEEIQRLNKVNEENINAIKKGKDFLDTITVEKLVGKSGYNIIKNEEKNLMAKTMHQTVKTLQEMIKQKTAELNYKNKIIDNLHDELSKTKSIYLQKINLLEDQLKDKHQSALNKIQNLLDTNKNNFSVKMNKNEISMMTMNELEKLLADKDNIIRRLETELKSIKEDNNNNYIKLSEKNKIIIDLEDKMKMMKLNQENDYNMALINKLKQELNSKNEMIEREKEKIEEIKNNFMKNYQDKALIEDEDVKSQKSEKYSHSVQLPASSQPVNDQEKDDLKKQIHKLKIQIGKLNEEKKKLNKAIEDLEKAKNEVNQELAKSKEDKKQILELQIKDNKKISVLNKEKEKLKKENNRLKEELEQIKIRLNIIEQENRRLTTVNSNLENELKSKPKPRPPSAKKEKNKIIDINKQKQSEFSMYSDTDELLKSLCDFCIKKNINLRRHLQRYDISKNGKITENDFKRAIEELKLGFIGSDLDKLANTCKSPHSNDVSIDNFLNLLNNKNNNFKKFIEQFSEVPDNIVMPGNKQATKKYDKFENKAFNIDYGI